MGQGRHREANITKRQAEVMQTVSRFFSAYGKMPTMRQLADDLGITPPSVYSSLQELVRKKYLKRVRRGPLNLYAISRNVEQESLVTVQMPLLGEIPAGVPAESAEDRRGGTVTVDSAFGFGGNAFALRVRGDSMIGAGIHNGDVVIIRRQPVAVDGDIVAASVNGEVTLKRLVNRPERIALEPENPEFKPVELTGGDSFRILGKFTGILRQGGKVDGGK